MKMKAKVEKKNRNKNMKYKEKAGDIKRNRKIDRKSYER